MVFRLMWIASIRRSNGTQWLFNLTYLLLAPFLSYCSTYISVFQVGWIVVRLELSSIELFYTFRSKTYSATSYRFGKKHFGSSSGSNSDLSSQLDSDPTVDSVYVTLFLNTTSLRISCIIERLQNWSHSANANMLRRRGMPSPSALQLSKLHTH